MSIGPIVIAQSAESLRKFRNTARFCLGNMGAKDALETMQMVPRSEMGLVRFPLFVLTTRFSDGLDHSAKSTSCTSYTSSSKLL